MFPNKLFPSLLPNKFKFSLLLSLFSFSLILLLLFSLFWNNPLLLPISLLNKIFFFSSFSFSSFLPTYDSDFDLFSIPNNPPLLLSPNKPPPLVPNKLPWFLPNIPTPLSLNNWLLFFFENKELKPLSPLSLFLKRSPNKLFCSVFFSFSFCSPGFFKFLNISELNFIDVLASFLFSFSFPEIVSFSIIILFSSFLCTIISPNVSTNLFSFFSSDLFKLLLFWLDSIFISISANGPDSFELLLLSLSLSSSILTSPSSSSLFWLFFSLFVSPLYDIIFSTVCKTLFFASLFSLFIFFWMISSFIIFFSWFLLSSVLSSSFFSSFSFFSIWEPILEDAVIFGFEEIKEMPKLLLKLSDFLESSLIVLNSLLLFDIFIFLFLSSRSFLLSNKPWLTSKSVNMLDLLFWGSNNPVKIDWFEFSVEKRFCFVLLLSDPGNNGLDSFFICEPFWRPNPGNNDEIFGCFRISVWDFCKFKFGNNEEVLFCSILFLFMENMLLLVFEVKIFLISSALFSVFLLSLLSLKILFKFEELSKILNDSFVSVWFSFSFSFLFVKLTFELSLILNSKAILLLFSLTFSLFRFLFSFFLSILSSLLDKRAWNGLDELLNKLKELLLLKRLLLTLFSLLSPVIKFFPTFSFI